jgi:hypothetical protein
MSDSWPSTSGMMHTWAGEHYNVEAISLVGLSVLLELLENAFHSLL